MNDELNANLKAYYDKIFPLELICTWLSLGQDEILSKREFSFTLDGDIYARYKSFENSKEFIEELKRKAPHKIDIGAVYNIKPKLSKSLAGGQMLPQWKELVFDIDMTDYDDIRMCCGKEEVKICAKCWTVMKAAVRVLDRVLRQDFGYNHVMWVYSGRRGVHCWVSDVEARQLPASTRSAIVEYATLVKRENAGKRVKLIEDNQWRNKYHPSIVKALAIVKQYFVQYVIKDQCLLDTPTGVKRVLQMLPKELSELSDHIAARWTNEIAVGESECRWKVLTEFLEQQNNVRVIDEIMLECLYPRLDANVSIGVNHLLKSPFCVHPGTGRVCVPFLASEVDNFDPFTVPTVNEVLEELGSNGNSLSSTSLGRYLKIFEDFVATLPKM